MRTIGLAVALCAHLAIAAEPELNADQPPKASTLVAVFAGSLVSAVVFTIPLFFDASAFSSISSGAAFVVPPVLAAALYGGLEHTRVPLGAALVGSVVSMTAGVGLLLLGAGRSSSFFFGPSVLPVNMVPIVMGAAIVAAAGPALSLMFLGDRATRPARGTAIGLSALFTFLTAGTGAATVALLTAATAGSYPANIVVFGVGSALALVGTVTAAWGGYRLGGGRANWWHAFGAFLTAGALGGIGALVVGLLSGQTNLQVAGLVGAGTGGVLALVLPGIVMDLAEDRGPLPEAKKSSPPSLGLVPIKEGAVVALTMQL